MAPIRRAGVSPLTAVLMLVLLIAGLGLRRSQLPRDAGLPPAGRDCRGLTEEGCRALGEEMWSAPAQVPGSVLDREEACRDAGYLCADVDGTGALRVLRWPKETPELRIWVPEPTDVPAAEARELQRVAVRGIEAWDGHPFPLFVRTRSSGEPPDITVQWTPSLGGNRIGRARIEWTQEGATVRLRVLGLELATRHPSDPERTIATEELLLVAAHEMGHALGLPHSDDPRDVMYPRNTARTLSVRDYRTMEALYSLPNGAEIRDASGR